MHTNMIETSLDDILTKYSRQEKVVSKKNHIHLSHTSSLGSQDSTYEKVQERSKKLDLHILNCYLVKTNHLDFSGLQILRRTPIYICNKS
jgi:hypothetical protein